MLELIFNNVRFREEMEVDIQAMIATTAFAERRTHEAIERYGLETVLGCVDEMIDRTERAVRAEIASIPDGTYTGESATDDDGTVLDEPVWVRVAATVSGDEMTLDFSASDDAAARLRQPRLRRHLRDRGRLGDPADGPGPRRLPQRGVAAADHAWSPPRARS